MFGRQLVAVIVFVLSWKTVNPATQGRFLYCVSFLMRVAHTGEHSTTVKSASSNRCRISNLTIDAANINPFDCVRCPNRP